MVKMEPIAFLCLWKDKKAYSPIPIDPESTLGKMLPNDIKTINITIINKEEKIVIDFGDKDIEDEGLVTSIFTASWLKVSIKQTQSV